MPLPTRALAPVLALYLCLSIATAAVFGAPNETPPPWRSGFDSIGEREIQAWVGFLASTELEGRATGEHGYDVAARFVESVLRSAGVEPGVGDSFFQDFDLVRRSGVEKAKLTAVAEPDGEAQDVPLGDAFGARGLLPIDWQSPWVFAGHGEAADSDAPDDLHGLDLAGSVVLILPRQGEAGIAHRAAVRRGARRIVVISKGGPGVPRGIRGPLLAEYRHVERAGVPAGVTVLYIPPVTADRILGLAGHSVASLTEGGARPQPFRFEGLNLHLELSATEQRMRARNVVGLIPGSDPELREEYIGVGAHLDHVGRRGDTVFPGADDDASGVAAVLAVAKALAVSPQKPRRSVVFLFFAAEEMGLHGSRYFSDHPTIPIDRLVVELQLDMVGRNEQSSKESAADNERSMHVVGSRRHSLELDPWVQRLNRQHVGLELEYDQESVYRRSDHWSFARLGVPVAFFFAGFHPDYHKPTDTADKLNYPKIASVSRLVFSLAYEIADRPGRLRVNRL